MQSEGLEGTERRGTIPADAEGQPTRIRAVVRTAAAGDLPLCVAHVGQRRGSLEAYLFGVARNLVHIMRRNGRVEEPKDQAIEQDLVGDLIKQEMVTALYAAMDALPDRYRDVVVLCELEERSYADAARLLACPVGTVRSRLHRARLFLAARLKPAGIVSEVTVK